VIVSQFKCLHECFNAETLVSWQADILTWQRLRLLTPLSLIFPCKLSIRLFSLKICTLYIYNEIFWQNFDVALRDLKEYLL
jgi:hypothetical protein